MSRKQYVGKLYSLVVTAVITLSYLLSVFYTPLKGYVRLRYYLAFVLVLLVLNFLLLRGKKWAFAMIMTGVVFASGVTVNPITIGLSNFYNNDLSNEVRSIQKKDPGASWISLSGDVFGTYLYANGIKDLDGTNYYPDMAKWKLLDPSGEYYSDYNRYAHIEFVLTKGQTQIDVNKSANIASPPDYVFVRLNVNELRKLNVSYILTTNKKIEQFDSTRLKFVNLTPKTVNGFYIYHVQY